MSRSGHFCLRWNVCVSHPGYEGLGARGGGVSYTEEAVTPGCFVSGAAGAYTKTPSHPGQPGPISGQLIAPGGDY